MQWIETTGKTVQDAVESALFQLGIRRDELEYTVISEPKRGILGILRSEARIRARVKPASFSPKTADRSGRRARQVTGGKSGGRRTGGKPGKDSQGSSKSAGSSSKKGKQSKQDAGQTLTSSKSTESDTSDRAVDSGRGKGAKKGPSNVVAASDKGSAKSVSRKDDESAGGRAAKGTPQPSSGGSASGKVRRQRDLNEQKEQVVKVKEEQTSKNDSRAALLAQAEVAQEFIEGLLDNFDIEADVEVLTDDPDVVVVNVTGEDLGILIGPKAATLSAIQDLTRTVVQRRSEPAEGRLVVDIAGYRARRRAALQSFARKIAEEVLASGKPRVLEPMNAADRKVVHDTIAELEGIESRSEGEEPYRRVAIVPESIASEVAS